MTELEISFINIMIDETLAVLFQRKRWVRYPLCKRLFHYIRRKQAIFTAVICKLEYRQKALYGCWVAKEIDCFFFFFIQNAFPLPSILFSISQMLECLETLFLWPNFLQDPGCHLQSATNTLIQCLLGRREAKFISSSGSSGQVCGMRQMGSIVMTTGIPLLVTHPYATKQQWRLAASSCNFLCDSHNSLLFRTSETTQTWKPVAASPDFLFFSVVNTWFLISTLCLKCPE